MLTLDRLLPAPAEEVDAAAAYAYPDLRRGQVHLRANMVASIDGAAALEGRVGALTGPADQLLLRVLRSLSDVLLVGAGTVRAEGYGPVRTHPALRDHRLPDQLAAPRLAVVTRTLDVDLGSPAFTEAPERPLVVTAAAADPARRAAAGEVADVVVAGEGSVDLGVAVDRLRERGLPRILSEGGPQVLGGLFAAGLVDELCLAVSPVVAGGAGSRITAGPALTPPRPLMPAAAYERDGFLFLRYLR